MPSTFKVSPFVTSGKTGYSSIIRGSYLYGSASTYNGPVYNSKPSSGFSVVYFASSGAGFAEGNRVSVEMDSALSYHASGSASPTSFGDYEIKRLSVSGIRFFVSKDGNVDTTEVFPQSDGTFVMPFDAVYFFVTYRVGGSIDGSLWYPSTSNVYIRYYVPDEIDEVEAIQDQTTDLMGTSGSDGIAGDVLDIGTDIVQGADFVQQTASFVGGAVDAVASAEPDGTVAFPGISLMGFSIPAQNVSVTAGLSPDLLEMIRTGVTVVVFIAWVNGLISLYHRLFLGTVEVESEGEG